MQGLGSSPRATKRRTVRGWTPILCASSTWSTSSSWPSTIVSGVAVQPEVELWPGTPTSPVDSPSLPSPGRQPRSTALWCLQFLFDFAILFGIGCSTTRVMQAAVTHEAASFAAHALTAEWARSARGLSLGHRRIGRSAQHLFDRPGNRIRAGQDVDAVMALPCRRR